MMGRKSAESASVDEVIKRLKVPIREALLQFCFEDRIEDVMKYEEHFTSQQLAEFGYPNLGGTSNRGEPKHPDVKQTEFRRRLDAGWVGLLLDFRQRLERGKIVVSGVRTHPNPVTEHTVIPGQWATDFKIDALKNTIEFRMTRYVAIEVGEPECFADDAVPAQNPVAVEAVSGRLPRVTAENLRDLLDDEVLLLLNDHADRVIRSKDGMLVAPGKITLIPIARGKMRHRAKDEELLPTITEEAEWLSNWLDRQVEHYAIPSPKTIGKMLGKEYKLLKPRSKPAT